MELSAAINVEIEKRFAGPDRETVGGLLATCRDERVCISVLRLSRGKVKRVEDLVKAAQRDYRDVIAWASQPTRLYIVGLLRKGPNWSAKDENERTHLDGRLLRAWKESGAIFVVGWFMDLGDRRSLYIFIVDSIEEAQTLVSSDEAIRRSCRPTSSDLAGRRSCGFPGGADLLVRDRRPRRPGRPTEAGQEASRGPGGPPHDSSQ